MKKYNIIGRFSAALMVLFVFFGTVSAYADVLGTPYSSKRKLFAQGTMFYTNIFDDSSVGRQTEHYIEYTPNPDVTPILTNGASVYGKRTLTQANSYLTDQGLLTAMGVNADFFSFQTGVPMSNVIIDKKVISSDTQDLPAVGFYEDGSAFMGNLPIATTMTTSKGTAVVDCINKYRQPYALYLYTSDFGNQTYATDNGIHVVLKNISGEITLDSKITAVVESIDEYEGSMAIPEGKWILSVSANAEQSIKDRLNLLTVGSKVTFTTKETGGDSRWKKAVYAVGGTGGKLITNGQLDYADESAAPRTAIGIRKDGTVLFYTIDGRQSGYSYGVRKETLAKRLLELGCVEALNLDGGGSTSIGGTLPGTYDFRVLNSPSGGGLRSCANFFFLKKNNAPTGIAYMFDVSHQGTPVLSGSSVQLKIERAYDTSFGPAEIPQGAVYTLKKDAGTSSPDGRKTTVTEDGYVTVRGNGDVYITCKAGGLTGETVLHAVATPSELKIYNAETGEEVKELVMEKGESISLTVAAYYKGEAMIVDDGSFTWRVVSDDDSIGTISKAGHFTASENSGATGEIGVNAGLRTYQIPVRIPDDEASTTPVAYPVIRGSILSDQFSATITSENGIVDTVKFYVDGMPTSANYNAITGTLSFDFPKDFAKSYHRLTLTATDISGASAIASYDFGTFTNGRSFPDTKGHWAENYIGYLADCGVVNGSDDGNFRPNDSMNRTEFSIMLCNYLGIRVDDYAATEIPFTDTADIPWWAMNHVKAAYALGIMQGQLTDLGVAFNPYAKLSRMEYAIAIERLLPQGLAKAPITAVDEADIPYWGKESLKMVTAQKILNGYPDGTLRPQQSVTRAEAVKILYSVFGAGK